MLWCVQRLLFPHLLNWDPPIAIEQMLAFVHDLDCWGGKVVRIQPHFPVWEHLVSVTPKSRWLDMTLDAESNWWIAGYALTPPAELHSCISVWVGGERKKAEYFLSGESWKVLVIRGPLGILVYKSPEINMLLRKQQNVGLHHEDLCTRVKTSDSSNLGPCWDSIWNIMFKFGILSSEIEHNEGSADWFQ